MQELIKKDWNGFEIEFELIDGQLMANATAMCAAFGKKPTNWLSLESTKRYVSALEAKSGILTSLVETRTGGAGGGGGTWIHERLILKLAAWLNVDFEIKCDEWVAELLRTGQVSLKPKSSLEVLGEVVQNLIEQDKRLAAVEEYQASQQQQVNRIGQQVDEVKAHLTTVNTDFFTVAGWASLQKKSVPTSAANALGRKAAALSKAQGFAIGKVSDARYGAVNSYHKDVLRQVIP